MHYTPIFQCHSIQFLLFFLINCIYISVSVVARHCNKIFPLYIPQADIDYLMYQKIAPILVYKIFKPKHAFLCWQWKVQNKVRLKFAIWGFLLPTHIYIRFWYSCFYASCFLLYLASSILCIWFSAVNMMSLLHYFRLRL